MNSSASIKDVILNHYQKYPKMEAEDYIKLLYQSAFGCGHILNKYSKEYLEDEYNQFPHDYEETYYIDIGNGYYRLDLSHTNLSKKEIYKMMKKASKKDKNADELFDTYLKVLLEMSKNNEIPVDCYYLSSLAKLYQDDSSQIPSHSAAYKQLYKPAYRIIKK